MGKNEFKLVLTVKAEKEDKSIYYKVDGERFNSNHTLKLAVETCYVLTLVFKPPMHISSASIMGSSVTVAETARDSDSATYTILWTSAGISATKRGQRDTMMISMEVADYGTLTTNLQVKFYKASSSQHCTWGTALHHVDYDCHYNEGASYVEIDKEIIR